MQAIFLFLKEILNEIRAKSTLQVRNYSESTNKKSSDTVSSQTADLVSAFPGNYLERDATTY